jgi:hypothetical protein
MYTGPMKLDPHPLCFFSGDKKERALLLFYAARDARDSGIDIRLESTRRFRWQLSRISRSARIHWPRTLKEVG